MIEKLINIQVDLKNLQHILQIYQNPKHHHLHNEVILVKNVQLHHQLNPIIIGHLQLINQNNIHHLITYQINMKNQKKPLYVII